MDTIYTLFRHGAYLGAFRERPAAQLAAQKGAEYRDELDAGQEVTWDVDATPGCKTQWVMWTPDGCTGYHVAEDQLR
jgi:hypothetical protein